MIVVSDTSCVTNLIVIGRAELLHELFGEVIVPAAVAEELRSSHTALPAFTSVREVQDVLAVARFAQAKLDRGESEAIVLAEELRAEFLLIDEVDGRAVAVSRRLRVIGLLGVLIRAKQLGLIAAVKPLVDELANKAGFWISAALRQRALEAAGEA